MTSDAKISPATDGTNDTLPGVSLREVDASSCVGLMGCSFEKITFTFLICLF